MSDMDHGRIVAELIRALRGRRSQPALSRRLGYGGNPVYSWENERRRPVASDLFRIAKRCGRNVSEELASFVGSPALTGADVTTSGGVSQLVNTLVAGRRVNEVARAIRKDRTTLARWLSGNAEPKAHELLLLVEVTTSRLLDFIALLVDPEQLSSTRSAHRDLCAQRRLAYERPWSHAVLRALELSTYKAMPKHKPGFIAREIGLSIEDEERELRELVDSNQVSLVGGRYEVQRILTVDTRHNEEANRRLKKHWCRVAVDRFETDKVPAEALFSYNLFATDHVTLERIRALHLEYYKNVRALVASSNVADRMVLLNVQLLPLSIATDSTDVP